VVEGDVGVASDEDTVKKMDVVGTRVGLEEASMVRMEGSTIRMRTGIKRWTRNGG